MLYLRICFDKHGGGELRRELLKSHREYIASRIGEAKNGIKVVQGGPMCATDDLSANVGSFLVVEAESLDEAKRFHAEDPFTQAGLFDRSDVVRWDRHVGNDSQTDYVP